MLTKLDTCRGMAAVPQHLLFRGPHRPIGAPRTASRVHTHVAARPETAQGGAAAAASQLDAQQQVVSSSSSSPAPQQQQQQEQQQQPGTQQERKGSNHTQARIRRNVRGWTDASTPNTGMVSVTHKSHVHGAAACVAADLETRRLTRVVPASFEQMQRAITTIRLAASIMQQKQAAAAAAKTAAASGEAAAAAPGGGSVNTNPVVLAFQPVQVLKELAAPPLLPEGATALYVNALKTSTEQLQDALKLRAASIAAAAAAGAQGGAAASTGRQAPGYGSKQVNVTGNSDPVAVASVLNKVLCQHGWAELVCLGRQDEGLANAMQALIKLRRVRYGKYKEDIAAVPLGDQAVLGEDGRSLPGFKEGSRDQPSTFLVLRCAKNDVTKLLPVEPNGAAVKGEKTGAAAAARSGGVGSS